MIKKNMRSLYIYITKNLNIYHDKWVKIDINNDSNAELIEKFRTIIFKIHQTIIQSKKYYTFKIIDSDNKSFENNIKKFENDLNHASMSTHNLIQDVKYFNFNVDNLILFSNIHDNLKFFHY